MTSIFDITACSVCMGSGKEHIGSVAAGCDACDAAHYPANALRDHLFCHAHGQT